MQKVKKGERFHLYSDDFPTSHLSDSVEELKERAKRLEQIFGSKYSIRDRRLEKWV